MTAYGRVEVEEPHKGLKIAGGIVSLGAGIGTLIIYVYYFIFSLFVGLIAIIFGEPRYWLLLLILPIIIAGGALLLTGGIMGFTGLSKTAVILAFIGSGIAIPFNVYLMDVAQKVEELAPLIVFPYIGLPVAIVGLLGAVLLALALHYSS